MSRSDRRCPCHSGRRYKRCCEPWHKGRPAPTPEALMRSRFSAYAMGLTDYILDTTDPDGPMWQADAVAWRAQVEDFSQGSRFRDLRILATDGGHDDSDQGMVHFRCRLIVRNEEATLEERSRFRRVDGRWLYHAAIATS